MQWLGLDIGGANLKVADGRGFARLQPFALWRQPQALDDNLRSLLANCPSADRLAVTMTGELADCYSTRAAGVASIVTAVTRAAEGRHVVFYRTDGTFVDAALARNQPELVASANWHVLAAFATRFLDGCGMLIDIGTTTSDLIRLVDGRPASAGLTDAQRLATRELVYRGIWRTPVAGVVETLPWRSDSYPVAIEVFATMLDVYLLLGDIREDARNLETADGRPATRAAAHARLARMICTDTHAFNLQDAIIAAKFIAEKVESTLVDAVRDVSSELPSGLQAIVISGAGEFLALRVATRTVPTANLISLARRLGSEVSTCAPAHAIACLAQETCA